MKLFKKKGETTQNSAAEQPKAAPAKKMNKKTKKRIITWGIIGVLLIGSFVSFQVVQAKMSQQLPMVPTIVVNEGDVEQLVSTSGFVNSEMTKTYYSPAEGTISACSVELGDTVEEGQMLVSFDLTEMELKKQQAALKADANSMTLKKSLNESQESEVKLAESANNVEFYKSLIVAQRLHVQNLKNEIADVRRQRLCELYGDQYRMNKELNETQSKLRGLSENSADYGNVSDKITELNNSLSLNSRELAEAQDMPLTEQEDALVQAQYLLTDIEGYLSEDKSQKATAEEKILNAYEIGELKINNQIEQLSVEEAEEKLSRARGGVIAEFNGIVTSLEVQSGANATLGAKLMTVESSDNVMVRVSLSKYDLEKVRLGQKVDIDVTGNAYQGTVTKINRVAEKNDAGTPLVSADIHIDNPDENIYLGIEAKVKIHTASAKGVVLAPVEVINADTQGNFCYVVENGIITKRRVSTGVSSDVYIEVTEGLKAGDQIVSSSAMNIEEGMQVAPVSTNSAAPAAQE